MEGFDELSFTENDGADTEAVDSFASEGTLFFNSLSGKNVVDVNTGILTAPNWNGGQLDPEIIRTLQSGLTISEFERQSSGNLNWKYNVEGVDLNFLSEEESIKFSYFVEVTDSEGNSAADTLTIFINGANDSPKITAENSNFESRVVEDEQQATSGVLNANDVDNSTLIWSVEGSSQGQYGSITIDELTGEWTYVLDGQDVENQNDLEFLLESFVITSGDRFGGSDEQIITIEIVQRNRTPEIVGELAVKLEENQGKDIAGDKQLFKAGKLNFTDNDQDDTLEIEWSTEPGTSVIWSNGEIDPEIAKKLEEGLSIEQPGSKTSGSVDWTYNVNPVNLDFLNKGEDITITYTVSITDDKGASSSQELVVTIDGANDKPVISTENGENLGEVKEQGNFDDGSINDGIPSVQGQLLSTDLDTNATATWFILQEQSNGIYGRFEITPEGVWTYTLDQDASNKLTEGETEEETFNAIVTDDEGSTAQQTVVVTISGTNDVPTIDSATNPATIDEIAGDSSAQNIPATTGTITFTDQTSGTHSPFVTGMQTPPTPSGGRRARFLTILQSTSQH